MSPATATRRSGVPDSYYAPEFLVEVEGVALDPVSKGDVLEIRVTMGLEEVTSVDLKVNNYDDKTFDLKWSESGEFALDKQVHVQLGYADRLVSMLRGKITTLSLDFSDGPPTLTVRALDRLAQLKGASPPEAGVTYKAKKDWQIAREVADRHKLAFKYTDAGPVRKEVVQRGLDDLAFLRERAELVGCDVFMRIDDSGKDFLHFQTPADGRGSSPMQTYDLTWGSLRNASVAPSLLEFKPTISTTEQVQSVTVRGWDAATTELIEATHPEGSADGKRKVVVNRPVHTVEEARSLAKALYDKRTYGFFTATARAIGLPDLRPGDTVAIGGVGEQFGGEFYVTKTTHVLNSSGLLTEFEVRRNQSRGT